MSQLIQLRHRIKTIETIKKITHAMQLIAMSTLSKLRVKEESVTAYQQAISHLFNSLISYAPAWSNPHLQPTSDSSHPLFIVVGSQKGLCGNFNTLVTQMLERRTQQLSTRSYSLIIIGKKLADSLINQQIGTLLEVHPEFCTSTFIPLASALTSTIIHTERPFTSVTLISNKAKNFFTQQPYASSLVPFDLEQIIRQAGETISTENMHDEADFLWTQTPDHLLNVLAVQCLETTIQHLLFQSLMAEQAARFVSMDSSTRSAKNLLVETRLAYNKLRQAKITKEITELSGSF